MQENRQRFDPERAKQLALQSVALVTGKESRGKVARHVDWESYGNTTIELLLEHQLAMEPDSTRYHRANWSIANFKLAMIQRYNVII